MLRSIILAIFGVQALRDFSEASLAAEAAAVARMQLDFQSEFAKAQEANAAALAEAQHQVAEAAKLLPQPSFLETSDVDPAALAAAKDAVRAFCEGTTASASAMGPVGQKLREAETKLRALCPSPNSLLV